MSARLIVLLSVGSYGLYGGRKPCNILFVLRKFIHLTLQGLRSKSYIHHILVLITYADRRWIIGLSVENVVDIGLGEWLRFITVVFPVERCRIRFSCGHFLQMVG